MSTYQFVRLNTIEDILYFEVKRNIWMFIDHAWAERDLEIIRIVI